MKIDRKYNYLQTASPIDNYMSLKIDAIIRTLQGLNEELKGLKEREKSYKLWLRKLKAENDRLQKKAAEREALKAELTKLKSQKAVDSSAEAEKKIKQLLSVNQIVSKQHDRVNRELIEKKQELIEAVKEAAKAKRDRDNSIAELDSVIDKLEEYQKICQQVRDRLDRDDRDNSFILIQAADRLFFPEAENIIDITAELDPKDSPQMFTDPASINRSFY